MKNLHTFDEFLNEAASTYIEDKGTLKTRIGNLKYEVRGGLDRGGNSGSYQIDSDHLAKLIGSIDMKTISKVLAEKGIEMNARPSEVRITLSNSGMGYNGLGAIRPELEFPIDKLPKDWPKKENGHGTTREEYAIYRELNDAFEAAIKGKKYWIRLSSESAPGYNSYIKPEDPRITVYFEDGSLYKD
jgi:hypothetical protein